MALKNVRGEPPSALQSFDPDIRLSVPSAIVVAQNCPLLKVALFATGSDGVATVALLRSYQKDDRLVVTVNRIGHQIENQRRAPISNTIERG